MYIYMYYTSMYLILYTSIPTIAVTSLESWWIWGIIPDTLQDGAPVRWLSCFDTFYSKRV